ncbi:MAG: hypothetical protein FGM39_04580 [Phycisphaerales bacterium]|nr:hypothetical protein [Phycisphaerales bacterium]
MNGPDPPSLGRGGRDPIVGSRIALRAFLGVLGFTVLLGLAFILDLVQDERLLMTSGAVAAGCLATLVAAFVADQGRFVRWMHVGMALGWCGIALLLALIWLSRGLPNEMEEFVGRLSGAFCVPAAAIVFVGMTTFPRARGTGVLVARWATASLVVFWAAFGEFALVTPELAEAVAETLLGWQWFGRCVGASAVIVAAGTVAQPVLIRLGRSTEGAESAIRGRRTPVACRCPRCGAACAVEANVDASCASCGLRIRIELEEPRCACGYLLFGLESPGCPECGAPVPESARWQRPADAAAAGG